ncbi:hypothetical protein D3C86_992070 [compost metagenome]
MQVVQQSRGKRFGLARRRDRAGDNVRCRFDRDRVQGFLEVRQPLVRACFEFGIAIDPFHQPRGAQFLETLIEFFSVLAELVVVGITQRQHCITQGFQAGFGTAQGLPETFTVVRRITVAEGAADQRQSLRTGEFACGEIGHRAQFDSDSTFAQTCGKTFGQGFGVACLRGPQQRQGRLAVDH